MVPSGLSLHEHRAYARAYARHLGKTVRCGSYYGLPPREPGPAICVT